jgi:hypothetical protein
VEDIRLNKIIKSLKNNFELSVYDFKKDTVIIKETISHKKWFCDVAFNSDNEPFFFNIKAV